MINLLFLISIIIALTIHEFSHAFIADRLGDPTPRANDRLSLNPLKHLDPIGTFMLIFARFGWGKPVPIDPYNLRNPRRDEILIALAGPASNLLLATVLSLVLRLFPYYIPYAIYYILISVNVSLAVFNLLPIPPLDGSKIFFNLLPVDESAKWEEELNRYGQILLIAALFLPLINGSTLVSLIMSPILRGILSLLLP